MRHWNLECWPLSFGIVFHRSSHYAPSVCVLVSIHNRGLSESTNQEVVSVVLEHVELRPRSAFELDQPGLCRDEDASLVPISDQSHQCREVTLSAGGQRLKRLQALAHDLPVLRFDSLIERFHNCKKSTRGLNSISPRVLLGVYTVVDVRGDEVARLDEILDNLSITDLFRDGVWPIACRETQRLELSFSLLLLL